jgi:AcrR family transcriptional regulator
VSDIEWVRRPRQARSQDTLDRLLDAAQTLLDEGTYADASVQKLVTRARSSVGAFYARFKDKDALLQHLHDRWAEEAIATSDRALLPERWHGVSVEDVVRATVTFVSQDYQHHAGLRREIVRQNHTDRRFRERSQKVAVHVTRAMARLLAERRDEIAVPDVLLAADMCHRIVFSVFDQALEFVDRPPGLLALPFDALVDEVCRAVLGYLSYRPPPARAHRSS